ncbi:MAG: extracellular solute-binding protein [Anaerocolumna sp.]
MIKTAIFKLLSVVLTVTVISSLGACSSPGADTQKAGETALETAGEETKGASGESDFSILNGKTISFMTSQAKYFDAYQTMADKIKEDYGCTVEFQVIPDDSYTSLTNLKLSTGEVPDVFEQNFPSQNATINVYQYCEDLSNESWVSRLINPELIKDSKDGKIYALPKESSSGYQAVYYNKALLEKCGIKDPMPKTYQEFLDILKAVKENSDSTPFLQTNADNWTTQIYMTGGIAVALGDNAAATYEKLLNNEITWSEIPEATDILQKYMDLYKAGYVNEDNLSVGYDDAAEIMASEKAAMYLTIEQWAVDFENNYDIELGAFAIPHADKANLSTGNYVQGLFVPTGGSQVDAAKKFLEVWSMPEYQNLYYAANAGFPAFNDVDGGKVTPCVQSLVDNYIKPGNYSYEINGQLANANGCFNDLWNLYIEAAADAKTANEVWDAFQPIYSDYMEQQGYEAFQ